MIPGCRRPPPTCPCSCASPERVNFKVHFAALAVAFAALLGYARTTQGQQLLLGNFALYGALHALCVVLALRRRPGLPTCALAIVLAALADGVLLYLGL